MSVKALSDYTFYSRYSQYDYDLSRRETWSEAVTRLFTMHRIKYADKIKQFPELATYIDFAEEQQKKKRVLASQRSLQFAIEPILKHELKMFNCLTTHIDRVRVFQESMYALLCGCGVGFSVQTQHISQLGKFKTPVGEAMTYVVDDSIEGWANAVGVLMASWSVDTWGEFDEYQGKLVNFDFSKIRPEGSLIANRYKAPGAEGLKLALNKMNDVLAGASAKSNDVAHDEFSLRSIDAYDIIMHSSDAVLSGGVRRSATICLFSHDDDEMMTAKTGNWYNENPQRSRSNNSAALLKGHVTKEQFSKLMVSTKEFGEPGFIWVDDLDIIFNPCCEIGMIPKTIDGVSGWQSCNLTEINGKYCDNEDSFLDACKASAIIGTLQAGYTNLKYLGDASKEIFEQEALLGCSITGWMDNPDILFDPQIQQKGANRILEVNAEVAALIGIKTAARATCVKPAGCGIPSTMLRTTEGIKTYEDIFNINGVNLLDHESSEDIWVETNKDTPTYIINENDEPELVTKLYINGYDDVYDLPLEDGTTITLTGKHKVKLVSGEWRRVDRLVEGDDIASFEPTCENNIC